MKKLYNKILSQLPEIDNLFLEEQQKETEAYSTLTEQNKKSKGK